MKKPDIARQLARRSGITQAEAADLVDGAVHEILDRLRNGKPATLPGLGRLTPGPEGRTSFRRSGASRRG